jgi:mannose-6-phosphate isomerase-like protein (cupin superfamily)
MLAELSAVLTRDLEAAAREVEAYPSDDALWRATVGISNCGGVLARHLAGNLRHFIGAVLGNSGYQRDRDDEFRVPSPLRSRAAVAAELRAAGREVAAALAALPLAALSDPFPVAVQDRRFSTLQFLLHLSSHLGYHLGQLDYHRRMLQPEASPVGAMALDALLAIPAAGGGAADSSAADHRSLDAAFDAISEPWSPVVIGALNGQEVKAVRLSGAFHWHAHTREDELFLVYRGRLRMEFRDRALTATAGEFIVVPRGVEHRPVAEPEAEVVLFEPQGIVRTGD